MNIDGIITDFANNCKNALFGVILNKWNIYKKIEDIFYAKLMIFYIYLNNKFLDYF